MWSACDTAHARWSKLISLRPPPTTLPHFTPLYSLTSTVLTATEGAGGRLGYGLRGTLHAHAKGFVDAQHAKRVGGGRWGSGFLGFLEFLGFLGLLGIWGFWGFGVFRDFGFLGILGFLGSEGSRV